MLTSELLKIVSLKVNNEIIEFGDAPSIIYHKESNSYTIHEKSSVGIFNYVNVGFLEGKTKATEWGSRGYGKTWEAIERQFKEIVKNENVSCVSVATTKNEHSTKLLMDWKTFLIQMNFKEEQDYRVIDTQSTKKITIMINGKKQELRFIGLDETSSAGWGKPDGPNSFFKIIHCDELASQNEKNVVDFEDKKIKLDGIKHLKGTIIRFKPENEKILILITFNASNINDPLLANANDPEKGGFYDDEKELEDKGFQFSSNEEETFLGGNYKINSFLNKDARNEYKSYKNEDIDYWKTYALGVRRDGANVFLKKLIPKLREYQKEYLNFKNEDFIYFRLGTDVGNGNAPSALILKGFHQPTQKWFYLRELEVNELNAMKTYDPDETTYKMILFIEKWINEFPKMKNSLIEWRVDNDANFVSIIVNAYNKFSTQKDLNCQLEIINYKEKYQNEVFGRKIRPIFWEYAISSKREYIFEKWTPKLFKQLLTSIIDNQGKFEKGNDHIREAAEICGFIDFKNSSQWKNYIDTKRVL